MTLSIRLPDLAAALMKFAIEEAPPSAQWLTKTLELA